MTQDTLHTLEATETEATQALAVALRVLAGRLRRRLREEATTDGLSESQRAVITSLDREGPCTVTQLAQAERMRVQSMGATVNALIEQGYVQGKPDPTDGRRTILSLTAQARRAIQLVRAAREDWLFRTLQERLSGTERRKLAHGVDLIKRLIDD